jgi:hypothetical protein
LSAPLQKKAAVFSTSASSSASGPHAAHCSCCSRGNKSGLGPKCSAKTRTRSITGIPHSSVHPADSREPPSPAQSAHPSS